MIQSEFDPKQNQSAYCRRQEYFAIHRRVMVLATVISAFALAACEPVEPIPLATLQAQATSQLLSVAPATPLPTRIPLSPGQIMEYIVQSGDTLEAVAAHFHSTVEEIRVANPELPRKTTTLEPGSLLRVPAYYIPLSGTPFQILPDSEVVFGPSASQIDVRRIVFDHVGFLAFSQEYAFQHIFPGWQIVQITSIRHSINPRLLLALLEYRSQALSRGEVPETLRDFPLGERSAANPGLAIQLNWVADKIKDGYYGWRTGVLQEIELADGRISRPDPWQNAGTVAVQFLMGHWFGQEEFDLAIGPEGFVQIYRDLFGDPWQYEMELTPGGLEQTEMQLPFEPGKIWAFTGGPHPAWGESQPWGALDFAPPSEQRGCFYSGEWITAVADGVVVRSEAATVVLDLDGDGDESTGWSLVYFHVAAGGRVRKGEQLQRGGKIGHPSCEGGRATGSHVHIARKYNGEWIAASGPLAFNLSGWVAVEGSAAYSGRLRYYTAMELIAFPFATGANLIALAPAPAE